MRLFSVRLGNTTFWLSLVIGLTACILLVADLGTFATHDEVEFWFARSESLVQAVQSGDYSLMHVSTHPGVTTMWLGGAGILLRRMLFEQGILQHETFPLLLTLYRLPAALVHTVGIVLGYVLLRRLFAAPVALLAAFLWAADPFVLGYSRLLHVDALMGTFATLSLLAACCAWNERFSWKWLIVSAVCAALALLSKSPALALGPVIVLLALAEWCFPRMGYDATERASGTGLTGLRHTGVRVLVWGVVGCITCLVLWPTLRENPLRVYEALHVGVRVEGAQPHMTGNFFLGREDPSPGMLFYPVALALRTTPLTLVGLLVLPFALRREVGRRMDIPVSARLRTLAVLAGFVLLFIAAMSFFPKKFNRYSEPVFPSLDILAAVGLVWLAEKVSRLRVPGMRVSLSLPAPWRDSVVPIVVTLCAVLAVVNAAWWHPYGIVAYNQMLGGAQAGARTFAVGWGEGLEQVAAWLNEQPDIVDVLTISHMITSLDPFLRKGARATFPQDGQLKPGAGYVVTYIYQVQGGNPPPPFNQVYGHIPPLHTVTLHGVDYAWVYDAPPLVSRQLAADFGTHIHLYGIVLDTQKQQSNRVRLKLVWYTDARLSEDYWLFAHVVGPDGRRYGQIDQHYETSQWTTGRFVMTELLMEVPNDRPNGAYVLAIGLYDTNGQRLPLQAADVADPALFGPNALIVQRME